ncbi:MAG: membrane protein insertase YidC [Deltaproteobacteria bacterium]|nr:membrane protein insertase YidC [Deltaproteobacteria bacterium]
MDRNLLLSIVLSVLIIVGFQYFFQSFSPPTPVNAPSKIELTKKSETGGKPVVEGAKPTKDLVKTEAELSTSVGSGANGSQSAVSAPVQESRIKVETPKYEAILTNVGGKIVSFRLKDYTIKVDSSDLVNLFPPEGGDTSGPTIRLTRTNEVLSDAYLAYTSDTSDSTVQLNRPGVNKTIVFKGVTPSGLVINKKFVFYADTYLVDLSYRIENNSGEDRDYLVTYPLRKHFSDDAKQFSWNSVEVLLDGVLKDYYFKDIKGDEELSGHVEWAGLGEAFFFKSLIFSQHPAGKVTLLKATQDGIAEILVRYGSIEIPAGKSKETVLGLYVGPKEANDLHAAGGNIGKALVYSHYQALNIMSEYLMKFLRFCNSGFTVLGLKIPGTGNYGIDIIILTILIKILFIPLTHKSMKSMKRMQDLQPQIAKLKEKLKDDKSALNKATMELFRDNKVNPLGSCWPMFLQIPVFIALYQALSYAIELRHAYFVCFPSIYFCIQDLSAPDPYYVTPVLMGGTMVLQQWMTPSAGDPMQKKMMLLMPVVFTYMFLSFPSGLVLYWLVSNMLSIGQQVMTNRLTR